MVGTRRESRIEYRGLRTEQAESLRGRVKYLGSGERLTGGANPTIDQYGSVRQHGRRVPGARMVQPGVNLDRRPGGRIPDGCRLKWATAGFAANQQQTTIRKQR